MRGPALARARPVAAALLVALPWLNPFALGPSAAVQPWLASAACAVLLWLLCGAPAPGPRARLPWAAAALVAWAVLSQGSVRPDVVFLAAGLAVIVLAASAARHLEIAPALQAGLLAAALASAVLGLVQYFGLAASLGPWVSPTQAGEAFANLRQPNQYASLTWIGAAVLLWGALRLRPAVALALVLLLAVGSAASASRTGMLQGLVLTLLAAAWPAPQRRQRLLLCGVAALAYFAATWLLPVLLESVGGAQPARELWRRLGGPAGCSSRMVLWSNVLHLIAHKPLAGWGWGNLDYAHFMTLYPGERFCDILDNAHDLPLHLAVELGVPAALLVCGGALWWAARQRPWREQVPRRQLAWALLALVSLHSLLEYPLWYGPFQIAFGLALGWLGTPGDAGAPAQPAAPRPGRGAFAAVVAPLLLAAVGYAAWDYERVSQIYVQPEERRAAWREDTLGHVRRSWLFAGQARFADLTMAQVTRGNAPRLHDLSEQMLHYSPEPRVIERSIESAVMLGRDDEALLQLARYRAAFPQEYRAWRRANALPDGVEP